MKVWLAGARGRLGSVLEERLARMDVELVATGRELDLGERDAVATFAARERPGLVVNAAAYTQVDAAEAHENEAFRANALAPEHLGLAARACGAEVLHFSTEFVFDGRAREPYAEDAAPHPEGAYARTKAEGERRLHALPEVRAWTIRTSWLFGDTGASFVTRMRELIAEREELAVVADQYGRPTYVPDLADAALRLAGLVERERHPASTRPYGIYHFANHGVTTRHALAEAVRERALGRGLPVRVRRIVPVATKDYPLPAARPQNAVLDTTKLERTLGIVPRDFRAALDEYFAKLG